MDKADEYFFSENYEDGFFQLGMALHPIMDSTAPAHEGFKIWHGNIDLPKHVSDAYHISDKKMKETLDRMFAYLSCYLYVYESVVVGKESCFIDHQYFFFSPDVDEISVSVFDSYLPHFEQED